MPFAGAATGAVAAEGAGVAAEEPAPPVAFVFVFAPRLGAAAFFGTAAAAALGALALGACLARPVLALTGALAAPSLLAAAAAAAFAPRCLDARGFTAAAEAGALRLGAIVEVTSRAAGRANDVRISSRNGSAGKGGLQNQAF